MTRFHAHRTSQRQRHGGAATLVVVMVLFLVMALLAAYANRSLILEQRISGSHYRAGMAQEMADAGLEWTLALLNGTAIDAQCQPVSTGGTRFVDKYLSVSAADRSVQSQSSVPADLVVDCVRTGTSLSCRCPAPDTRTAQPATPAAGRLVPSFGIALMPERPNPHHGIVQVSAIGCTDSSVDSCGGSPQARSAAAIGLSGQLAAFGFIAAVPTSPASPLTVKGRLTTSGTGGLGLHNTDPGSAGALIVSGGAPAPLNDARLDTLPGTPPTHARMFNDSRLQAMPAVDFFKLYLGMASRRYQNHPSLRVVRCTAADCGPDLVNAYDAGSRLLWVDGATTIASDVVIGSLGDPALIIVNGAATLSGPMQINGMLVVLGQLDWRNASGLPSLITGMVLVQGDMTATGSMDIHYQRAIANQLRNRQGSYARVSGGLNDRDGD